MIRLKSIGLVDAPCLTPFSIVISPMCSLLILREVVLCS